MRTLPKPPQTVDLHAEALVDYPSDYSADELAALAIDRLRETLDAAIYWSYEEIRYIHGKGKGTLRTRVYQELKDYQSDGAIGRFYPSYHNDDIVVVQIDG